MRRMWNCAKGNHCFSVGFLAFSLTGLVQPGAQTGQPLPQPPAAAPAVEEIAVVPQEPVPSLLAHPAGTAPLPAAAAQPQEIAPPVQEIQTRTAAPAGPAFRPEVRALELHESHGIPESPFGELIYEIAGRHAVNPYLVAAIVRVESSFNPRAVSRKGACGLMQLLPATARRFGLRRGDIFDPAKNLEAGVRYLKWLAQRFSGDPTRVLAAYNAGEGAVDRYGGVPPYRETRSYVRRIFSMLGLNPEQAAAPASSGGNASQEMFAGR